MCRTRKETTNENEILSFLLIFGELEIECICLGTFLAMGCTAELGVQRTYSNTLNNTTS